MLRTLTYLIFASALIIAGIVFWPQISENIGVGQKEKANPTIIFDENPQNTGENPQEENLTFDQFINKGEDFADKGLFTLAINNFSAAVTLEPTNKKARLRLIETMVALRDFSGAAEAAKSALQKLPADTDISLLLGEILIQSSQFPEAKAVFAAMPNNIPEKFFFLGAIAAFENQHEEAKKNLEIAKNSRLQDRANVILGAYNEFNLFPNGNPLHLQLLITKSFDQLELFEMAVQSAKMVLKENSKYRDAWLILGHAYLALEKVDFAKSAFIKALELDPTKPETLFFLGLAEEELKNYNEALVYMEKALLNGYAPKTDVLKKLGDMNTVVEKYSAAVQYYEEVLKISDKEVGDFIRPIWILTDYLHDGKRAEEIAKQAVEKHPQSAMAYNLLGWAQVEKGDLDNAEKNLGKAVSLDPNLAAAYLNFGKLYEKKGEKENALVNYKKAYEKDPGSSVGTSAAAAFNRLMQPSE